MLTQVGRRHLQDFASNLHKHLGPFTRKSVRKSRLLLPWSHELDMCQKRTLTAQSAEQEDITAGLRYQQLKNRGLIRFAGSDSTEFLQGLITNDMRCIQSDSVFQKNLNCHKKAIYAFLLNVKGRVICDMIVYNIGKAPDTHIYLLELDKDMVDEVHSTMKKYRLRKKVDIAVTDELKVVAVFPFEDKPFDVDLDFGVTSSLVAAEKDPRVSAMGYRLVLPAFDKITPHLPSVTEADDPHAYQLKRLRLGIGEGPTDYPPGKALPLECNGAYLHGVSFDKGCYIGQELTARSHHTGVIRKRIMPLLLHSENNNVLQMDDIFVNSDGKEAGTFRSAVGQYGLGLMRLQEAKGPLTVKRKVIGSKEAETIDGVTATASQPTWWPT